MAVTFFVPSTLGCITIRRSLCPLFSLAWVPWLLGGLVLLGSPDSRYAIPSHPTHLRPYDSRFQPSLGALSCSSGLSPSFMPAPIYISRSSIDRFQSPVMMPSAWSVPPLHLCMLNSSAHCVSAISCSLRRFRHWLRHLRTPGPILRQVNGSVASRSWSGSWAASSPTGALTYCGARCRNPEQVGVLLHS